MVKIIVIRISFYFSVVNAAQVCVSLIQCILLLNWHWVQSHHVYSHLMSPSQECFGFFC